MRKCSTTRGPLNTLVTIQKPSVASADQNAYGEIDLHNDANWSDYATRRAHRRNTSGSERFGDDQTVATRNVVFELYADSLTRQVSATYRIKYKDRDGVIHKLGIVERRLSDDERWVELFCIEDAR